MRSEPLGLPKKMQGWKLGNQLMVSFYGWFVCLWLAGCGVLVVVVYDVPCDFCSGGVYVVNQFGG